MSDDQEKDEYSFERTLGIITAFDAITFGDNKNLSTTDIEKLPLGRTAFTVDDIYILLRKLKRFADPTNVDRLERLLIKHVNDKDNPHKLSIEDLCTSIMNELYKDWLNYKNRTEFNNAYTEEELKKLLPTEQFIKVLFQQITIADLDTALEGTSTSEVVNPLDLAEIIKRHNESLDAHSKLFDYLFPGRVHTYTPTLAMTADIDSPFELKVERNGPLSYMGPDGKIHTAKANILPVDWSTGVPAYPIFDTTTNYCLNRDLTNNLFIKTNVEVEKITHTVGLDDTDTTFKISSIGNDTCIHKLSYVVPAATIKGKKSICISLFVRSNSLDNIGINVHTGTPKEYNCWHYNISNTRLYKIEDMDDDIFARITPTPTGFVRCTYIAPIKEEKDTTIDIHLLDIWDGDLSYLDKYKKNLYIDGLQIEFNTDTPSTYKPTSGSIVIENATVLYIDVSSETPWYNQLQGGIEFEISGINPLAVLNTPRYVFDLVYGINTTAMAAFYPAVHQGRLTGYYADSNGKMSLQHSFARSSDSLYHKYGLSFANSGRLQPVPSEALNIVPTKGIYTLGDEYEYVANEYPDLNTAMTRLYIGCKGPKNYFLNGYLRQLIYYPTLLLPDHLKFFIKG